jgi:hypothetical protein
MLSHHIELELCASANHVTSTFHFSLLAFCMGWIHPDLRRHKDFEPTRSFCLVRDFYFSQTSAAPVDRAFLIRFRHPHFFVLTGVALWTNYAFPRLTVRCRMPITLF